MSGPSLRREKDRLAAAYCIAHVLRLDIANPKWLAEAEPFFRDAGLQKDTSALLAEARQRAGGVLPDVAEGTLPQLLQSSREKGYRADQLFAQAAPSVVPLKAGRRSGTGVCIGKGLLLTNHHVVDDFSGNPEIVPYQWQNGKLKRLEAIAGEIVFQSPRHDLALVKIRKPPQSLRPLPVAVAGASVGTRGYALGHPGLGEAVLDQSFSEGIISSATRRFGGKSSHRSLNAKLERFVGVQTRPDTPFPWISARLGEPIPQQPLTGADGQ